MNACNSKESGRNDITYALVSAPLMAAWGKIREENWLIFFVDIEENVNTYGSTHTACEWAASLKIRVLREGLVGFARARDR